MNNSQCCENCNCGKKSRLSPCALAFAFGIVEALFLFLLAIDGFYWNEGLAIIQILGSFLHGYSATPSGAFIGALWGFFDGFICGIIVGLVYNFCMSMCDRKKATQMKL